MSYRLWLPVVGAYFQAFDRDSGHVTVTCDEAAACRLLDGEARAMGQALAEVGRTTVDLRPIYPN
jgi:hypothetical protein